MSIVHQDPKMKSDELSKLFCRCPHTNKVIKDLAHTSLDSTIIHNVHVLSLPECVTTWKYLCYYRPTVHSACLLDDEKDYWTTGQANQAAAQREKRLCICKFDIG